MIRNNFIKALPETHNAAVDESLLILQVRVRKGSEWETSLREWLDIQTNEQLAINTSEKRLEGPE